MAGSIPRRGDGAGRLRYNGPTMPDMTTTTTTDPAPASPPATTTKERVTILGDGAMATVCSILLTQGGHDVTMWGAFEESIERLIQNREQSRLLKGVRIPTTVRLTANDHECFTGATLILAAIPTQYMRSVFTRLAPHVPRGVPIVSVAKGIEVETTLRPTQIICDTLAPGTTCPWPLAALSGPNIAAELARYLPATAVAA